MSEANSWSTLACAIRPLPHVDTPYQFAGKNTVSVVTELANVLGIEELDHEWSFISTDHSETKVNLTVSGMFAVTEQQDIDDRVFKALGVCKESYCIDFFTQPISSDIQWANLQIMFTRNSDQVPIPLIHNQTSQAALNLLLTQFGGIVTKPLWSYSSHLPNGICLNIALPVLYIHHAVSKLDEHLTCEIQKTLKLSGADFDCAVDAVMFSPSLNAVEHSKYGTTAIEYTVKDFCYAVDDQPASIESLTTRKIFDIVQANLRLQAGHINKLTRCLDDDLLFIANPLYDIESLWTRTNDDGTVSSYCDLSFVMNIDVVGPFHFGVILEKSLGVIIDRVPCTSRQVDNICYNMAAFGDLFQSKLSGLSDSNENYAGMQDQTVIFKTETSSIEVLHKLLTEVGKFLELSASVGQFPLEAFSIEPQVTEEMFRVAIGFRTNDAPLIDELRKALNEIRLSDIELSLNSDSFGTPIIKKDNSLSNISTIADLL